MPQRMHGVSESDWQVLVREDVWYVFEDLSAKGWREFVASGWEEWAFQLWWDRGEMYNGTARRVSFLRFRAEVRVALAGVEAYRREHQAS